jgi:hypothetical protein
MLGYVAEILLKVAFFRVRQWPVTDAISLQAIRTHAAWSGVNLHDVTGLATVLIAERHATGDPFDPVFAGELIRRAATLDLHWRESLRYRSTQPSAGEIADTYESVEWIMNSRDELRR